MKPDPLNQELDQFARQTACQAKAVCQAFGGPCACGHGRFRQVLDALPAAAYTCDRDGLLTYFNTQAAKVWGREPKLNDPADRFCGSSKLFAPDGSPVRHEECWMARALRDDREYAGEEIIVQQPTGRRVTTMAYASPVHDPSGELVGAVNVLIDITGRKETELDMARLAAIVQSSDDAIVSKTLDGVITSWNPGAQRIFGYTAEEAVGQSIYLIIPPDRHDEERLILSTLRQGKRLDHMETKRLTKDGRLIDISATISPMHDPAGRIIGASKIARDITRQKALETQLKEINQTLEQRIEERTAEIRALAAELNRAEETERQRLAHVLHDDLQQLLAAAKMRADVIARQAGADAQAQAAVTRQSRAVESVARLIDQSIDVSRSLAMEISPPILHEQGLIPTLQWLSRWMQENHALTVHVQADPSAEPKAKDLRILLFRAARELLQNVTKHAGVNEADITVARDDRNVRLTVQDAGQGFSPDHAPESTTPQTFGLISIKERLRQCGGCMTIESQPGQGTRITLEVPCEG